MVDAGHRRARIRAIGLGLTASSLGFCMPLDAASAQDVPSNLTNLSIEDLGNIDITSVSKVSEPLSTAPAAIYVITHDEIIRSGAVSIPEILRLAPNLQVARISNTNWAISARGFNSSVASKLLVLIDGRSVYSSYHSGVFWDMLEVPADTIERIEVISGPGATLWGANAVNGVINIITRNSKDTQGGTVELDGGNREQRAVAQYGGKLGDDVTYRAYIDSMHQNHDITPQGASAKDGWDKTQGGFRLDWTPAGDLVTLQGDFYGGTEDQIGVPAESISGHNVLARWTRELAEGSALQVQIYLDHSEATIPGGAGAFLDNYDLDVQHSFSWGSSQNIVWGGGYRLEQSNLPPVSSSSQVLFFSPQRRSQGLVNTFVQDSIALAAPLTLILGTKIENDPYTGLAILPSARLSWKVTESNLLWAAVSRADRSPSRLDRDLFVAEGSRLLIEGGDFQSERLVAYELGYRAQPSSRSSVSISTFYNVYSDLRSAELSAGAGSPIVFANRMEGDTYGVELWGNYRIADWWRVVAGANWLHKNLHFEAGSSGLGGIPLAGDDPTYQLSFRSTMNIATDWALDLDLRHIGALPNPASPSYTELDGRVAWTVTRALEIALTGSNLLHAHHLEFGTTGAPLQIGSSGVETQRSFVLSAKWKF